MGDVTCNVSTRKILNIPVWFKSLMELFRNRYRIKSTRLKEWDYSSNGYYFVTICTHNHECVLGKISGCRDVTCNVSAEFGHNMGDVVCNVSTIKLSEIGKIAEKNWREIPEHFKCVKLDEFIIMPNHLHGIVIIDRDSNGIRRDVTYNVSMEEGHKMRDVACNVSTKDNVMSYISPKGGSLSTIIRSYKASVTRWCKDNHITNFSWQSSFYEHIIRDEKSLNDIRKYIVYNPQKWESDEENPLNL